MAASKDRGLVCGRRRARFFFSFLKLSSFSGFGRRPSGFFEDYRLLHRPRKYEILSKYSKRSFPGKRSGSFQDLILISHHPRQLALFAMHMSRVPLVCMPVLLAYAPFAQTPRIASGQSAQLRRTTKDVPGFGHVVMMAIRNSK